MGKATDFKFGQYIQRVHPNKSPLKIFKKRERGRIQGLSTFLGTPYYLRNGKATDFKFGQFIQRVHPNKIPLKILEKGSVGERAYPGTAQFYRVPHMLSQERVKLRNSTFACTFIGLIGTKAD